MKTIKLILLSTLLWQVSFGQTYFSRTVISDSNQIRDSLIKIGDSFRVMHISPQNIFLDSLVLPLDKHKIIHYHWVADSVEEKIKNNSDNSLFNDSLNKHSRLILKDEANRIVFDVPTVPLTDLVYVEKVGLIIGLSKIELSPYHIVIYKTDGRLVSKRILRPVVCKFEKGQLIKMLKSYPGLEDCLSENVIVKDKDSFYIEKSKCLLQIVGQDTLFKMHAMEFTPYFPMALYSTPGHILYNQFAGFFDNINPFHDLVMVGSTPYVLILNSMKGEKVNIPLVSSVVD